MKLLTSSLYSTYVNRISVDVVYCRTSFSLNKYAVDLFVKEDIF